jgi:signal transduction histidine kinase
MNEEIARHAFDRFYRGERRDVEGSGLGLAIAQRAVQRAGGTIELTTSVTGGSRILIVLPRQQ